MIKLQIVTNGDSPGPWIEDEAAFDAALAAATDKARAAGRAELIALSPAKGYSLSLAVGADETYLVFGGKGRRPMYCHSRGPSNAMEPWHISYQGVHELQTPRRLIIPMEAGLRAAREFIADGKRPASIQWEEMVP